MDTIMTMEDAKEAVFQATYETVRNYLHEHPNDTDAEAFGEQTGFLSEITTSDTAYFISIWFSERTSFMHMELWPLFRVPKERCSEVAAYLNKRSCFFSMGRICLQGRAVVIKCAIDLSVWARRLFVTLLELRKAGLSTSETEELLIANMAPDSDAIQAMQDALFHILDAVERELDRIIAGASPSGIAPEDDCDEFEDEEAEEERFLTEVRTEEAFKALEILEQEKMKAEVDRIVAAINKKQ